MPTETQKHQPEIKPDLPELKVGSGLAEILRALGRRALNALGAPRSDVSHNHAAQASLHETGMSAIESAQDNPGELHEDAEDAATETGWIPTGIGTDDDPNVIGSRASRAAHEQRLQASMAADQGNVIGGDDSRLVVRPIPVSPPEYMGVVIGQHQRLATPHETSGHIDASDKP